MHHPRVNHEGVYTDTGTVDADGNQIPYTAEEIERTRAYEKEHGIPSTVPAKRRKSKADKAADVADEAEADEAEADESDEANADEAPADA